MPAGTVVASGSLVSPGGAQGPSGATLPVGSIIAYCAGGTPPASWMAADGSAISRSLYPDLWTLIGTTYGIGDGSTTFNLPDLRGRAPLGSGQGASLTNRILAATGGEENHPLILAELAAHTHGMDHQHPIQAGQFSHYHVNPNSYIMTGGSGVGNATTNQGGAGGVSSAATLPAGGTDWASAANAGWANTASVGSGSGHNNMAPFLVLVWIIKVSVTGGPTAQAPIADATQAGLLNKLSGNATDYVGGDNACHSFGLVRALAFNAVGNPTFEVQQINPGITGSFGSGSGTSKLIDRWTMNKAGTSTITFGQAPGITAVPGTNFAISSEQFNITLTGQQATLGASDYIYLAQAVEGPQLRELINDVHSISILTKCSAVITFGVTLLTATGTTYSLTQIYSIPANQLTLCKLPNIPIWAPAATWPIVPGQQGYQLSICLGAGSTYTSPANGIWQAGNFIGGPGITNFASLPVNTVFSVAFVQHEPGGTCTPLIDKPFPQNYDECLRYFQKTYDYNVKPGATGSTGSVTVFSPSGGWGVGGVSFKKLMAKDPTVTLYNPNTGAAGSVSDTTGANITGATAINVGMNGFGQVNLSGSANTGIYLHYTADTGW